MNIEVSIFQLKDNDERHDMAFLNLAELKRQSIVPKKEMYDMVFTYETEIELEDNICSFLEEVFMKFNIGTLPYKGHSLSVGDVVCILKRDLKTTEYYFVDSFGFIPLVDFE